MTPSITFKKSNGYSKSSVSRPGAATIVDITIRIPKPKTDTRSKMQSKGERMERRNDIKSFLINEVFVRTVALHPSIE